MEMSFAAECAGSLSLVLAIHTEAPPRAEEWRRYEELLRDVKRRSGDRQETIRLLVISDGGAPDTRQRHAVQNEIWGGRPIKMSLLTNSLKNPIKRGIANALSWMNPALKICGPHDLPDALLHLDLLHHLDATWELCRQLQAPMAPNRTLALIADALKRPRLSADPLLRAR